jgi:hypothetical protein
MLHGGMARTWEELSSTWRTAIYANEGEALLLSSGLASFRLRPHSCRHPRESGDPRLMLSP